ncbi:lipase [Mycena galericulata]|nr:lipase [Mycena galericulata]
MKAVFLAALFVSLAFASPAALSSSSQAVLTSRPIFPLAISPSLYDDFVRYTKYSSAAYKYSHKIYRKLCHSPLGNTLIHTFERGRTQGFIARDDDRREIVITFRGTFSLKDALTGSYPPAFPSTALTEEVYVHRGFMASYEDVADDVLATVKNELGQHPTHTIIRAGHSLGGAIASIAAPLLKAALPDITIKLYTFGQPRVGDQKFARFVEKVLGEDNIFRGAFVFQGSFYRVPMVPKIKYKHFGTEYWQFKDPWPLARHPETTVTKCDGGEDPNCSRSNCKFAFHFFPSRCLTSFSGWRHITPYHQVYFGYGRRSIHSQVSVVLTVGQ